MQVTGLAGAAGSLPWISGWEKHKGVGRVGKERERRAQRDEEV